MTDGCAVKFPLMLKVPPLNVMVMFAPLMAGLKFALAAERITPEARLMLCTRAVVAIVFVIAPAIVRFPLTVRVEAAEFPYVNDAIVVGVVSVGFVVIAPVPISTASLLPGGVLGVPLTTVQLDAVSQAALVAPVQRTVP
jgi:small ligand-binding sensory domain FIST